MLQFCNSSRVMETRDHFKNGASPKSQMIRRKYFKSMCVVKTIFCVIFFLSITSGSCEKEDDISKKYNSCDDIKSETSLFTKLKVKVVDNRLHTYNSVRVFVKLSYLGNNFIVAEAEGKNPTLTFKDVPDEYLTNILTESTSAYYSLHRLLGYESNFKISNENAKIAFGHVYAGGNLSIGTDDGVWNTEAVIVDMCTDGLIGSSYSSAFDGFAWGYGWLVYSNTDCNITGKLGFIRYPSGDFVNQGIIDIRLKKGWNKIFDLSTNDCEKKFISIGTEDVGFFMNAG